MIEPYQAVSIGLLLATAVLALGVRYGTLVSKVRHLDESVRRLLDQIDRLRSRIDELDRRSSTSSLR